MLALNKQIPQHLKSPNSHPVSMPEDLKAEIESKAPVSETEIQNMRNLNLNLNSAQFFYLAPKFPQHLKFDKNMHIHFPYKVKRWPTPLLCLECVYGFWNEPWNIIFKPTFSLINIQRL